MNEKIVVYAYNATGKTETSKKYTNVVDLDSAPFLFVYDESVAHLSFEEKKGLIHLRHSNPQYPQNFIKAIKDEFEKGKIVLVPFNDVNIEALTKQIRDVQHIFVYPAANDFELYAARMKERGNNDLFIERRKGEFLKFLKLFKDTEVHKKIIIKPKQFLDEVLIENGIELL